VQVVVGGAALVVWQPLSPVLAGQFEALLGRSMHGRAEYRRAPIHSSIGT